MKPMVFRANQRDAIIIRLPEPRKTRSFYAVMLKRPGDSWTRDERRSGIQAHKLISQN